METVLKIPLFSHENKPESISESPKSTHFIYCKFKLNMNDKLI